MAGEPGGRDDTAARIQGKSEKMPVGEERSRSRRKLGRPPAIREERSRPAAREQQNDDGTDDSGKPSTPAGQLYLTA